jgi:hypothetical protein
MLLACAALTGYGMIGTLAGLAVIGSIFAFAGTAPERAAGPPPGDRMPRFPLAELPRLDAGPVSEIERELTPQR